jgi:hypothetical protein
MNARTLDRLNRRFGPWISLGLGILSVVVFRRGIGYAPVAAATLIVGWTIVVVLGQWLGLGGEGAPVAGEDGTAPGLWPRLLRILRTLAGSWVVSLYQNVLFYLVPVWFASAVWPSANVAFPALLAAMAVFSCFEFPYRHLVLQRPVVRTLWSALVLFAVLVPAAPSLVLASPRMYVALSSGVAALLSVAALATRPWTPRPPTESTEAMAVSSPAPRQARVVWLSLAVALAAAGLLTLSAPLLPPVPVVCVSSGAGTGVHERQLTGESERFEPGVSRVYAWFAVALPPRDSQEVLFAWFRDGSPVGRGIETTIRAGRKEGWRTWAFRTAPGPGDWRADLLSDGGQLIGRVRFTVGEAE